MERERDQRSDQSAWAVACETWLLHAHLLAELLVALQGAVVFLARVDAAQYLGEGDLQHMHEAQQGSVSLLWKA